MDICLSEASWLKALQDPGNTLRSRYCGRLRMNEGWKLDLRQISEHIAYFITENRVSLGIDGKTIILEPNSFIWISAGSLHEIRNTNSRLPASLLHLRFQLWSVGRQFTFTRPYVLVKEAAPLEGPVIRLLEELRSTGPYRMDTIRSLLILISALAFKLADRPHDHKKVLSYRQQQQLYDYVERQDMRRLRPVEIARQVNLVPEYFARIFKRTFGMAPRTWLVREKMKSAAILLLETNLTVGEIASRLGHRDIAMFSKQFKNVYSQSPRSFRNNSGNMPQ